MTRRISLLLSAVGVALWCDAAVAQEVERVPVDRVVAVVGEAPITMSRLLEQENTWRGQGGQLPEDPAQRLELRRTLLQSLIDQELMIQAAYRDTMVVVTEEEVQSAVDETLQNIRDQIPSDSDLDRELQSIGFRSLDDYRLWLGDQQRRTLLQEMLIEVLRARGDIVSLPPTEDELRAYYEMAKGQLGQRPATASFRQIVVLSQPDTAALREAFNTADSVRALLEDGADFGELAQQLSADSGSAVRGGELGWFRRGAGLVREFEDAAFRLQPGTFSRPVLTTYGFHIIQVQRAEPASIQARHILIAPNITDENREVARVKADSVARMLRSGTPYDSLYRTYHSRDEERVAEDAPRESLPQEYQDAINTAQVGDILGPLGLDRGNGRRAYAVVVLEGTKAAGIASFEEVREQLSPRLAEQNGIERYLQTLRSATYIDIRL